MHVDNAFNAPFPRSIKINPIYPQQNIDPDRLPPKSNELARVDEVVHTYVCERSAESDQRSKNRFRAVGLDEQIHVLVARGWPWNETA